MALTDPIDTLAYHQSRVLCAQRDMSEVPVHCVTAALTKFQAADTKSATVPESEALWFYGMNHSVALIASKFDALQPLPEWELDFVNSYHQKMMEKALRAFYYLLIICTREARHNQSLSSSMAKMTEQFGKPAAEFFKASGGEGGIHSKLLKNPPKTTIGQFVECIRWQFYNSSWNGGYGGKKWGQVTDCLCRFVKGEFSAEMMLDTIWTLSHNNGPIFNKGHFYTMYSGVLVRILDVQRSGQVPQGVLFDPMISGFAESDLIAAMKSLKQRFPQDIGDYVDWEVVEALGSVHKYPNEKKAQTQKYGLSPEAKAAQDAKVAAEKAKAEAEAAKKLDLEKNWLEIMPGQHVKKVEVLREAA